MSERAPSNWGCATLLGVVVGFSLALNLNDVSARRPAIIIVGCTVLMSLAAWRWRQRFWDVVERLLGAVGRFWWFW